MMRAVNTCIRLFADTFDPPGPIVEFGSFYIPGWEHLSDLRPYFPGREYTGCDIRSGSGVDQIEDAESPSFATSSTGTVVMCDMLAHTPHPHRALLEVHRILSDEGLLALSAPFNYRISAFPDDYFRFTSSGLNALLEPFGDRTIFAVGPRVKPRVVFAVAAKQASSQFSAQSALFQARVHDAFQHGRLRAHLNTAASAGREVVGTLLGRAHLGVAFLQPSQTGGYRAMVARAGEREPPGASLRRSRPREGT